MEIEASSGGVEQGGPTGAPAIAHCRPHTRKTRNRGKKGTAAQVEERVIAVARMLAARVHKHQIKQFLATKFGLGPRSAEIYIARARAWMLKQVNKPREQFVAEAVGFYHEILRDPATSIRDKMEAQAGLRELLGLDRPLKVAPTDVDGRASLMPAEIVQSMSMAELAVLRALNVKVRQYRREKAENNAANGLQPLIT